MEYNKMENPKKQRKLKKLHIDLPKIINTTTTSRQSQKQNQNTQQLNLLLSPKLKNLRKLFFQHRSNARILQKSPYYTTNIQNRQKLVEMISTRRYDLTDEVESEIKRKYGSTMIVAAPSTNNTTTCPPTTELKVNLHYDNRTYSIVISCTTISELSSKITLQLARIMYSLKNTYKKLDLLLCYETVNVNSEVDFILSNGELSAECLQSGHNLSLRPVFLSSSSTSTKQLTLNDFKFIKCLGNGGFSTVYLVKNNLDSKYYAMKLINKKFIVDSERQGIVENQRFILGELSSQLVTGLEFAFETKNHFALVVEYCPGGELFYQLKKVKRMQEHQAKFYFLQILCGLDYIHSKNIIYRDLKPQNLLLGIDGHVKIADFGLSKPVEKRNQKSFSFCGSPEYMAPQMLLKMGHNSLLDYYCLGALLYELVVGVPPYYSLSHDEIYDSILNQELTFPEHVELSDQIKSMLRKLLQKDAKKRLGSMFGVKEILMHPWVGKVKQATIQNKGLAPPFMPDLQQFNFDLGDIKSDLQGITKLVQEDIIAGQDFETLFSHQFYFEKQDWRANVQKMAGKMTEMKVKKILKKSQSVQNCHNFTTRAHETTTMNETSRQQQNSLIKASNFCPSNEASHTTRLMRKAKSSKALNMTATMRK